MPPATRSARDHQALWSWIIFSLLIGLVPMLVRFLGLKVFGMYANVNQVLGDGGLLLIATAVGADTLGVIFPVMKTERASAFIIMLTGGAFLTSLISSALWGMYALVQQMQTKSTADVGSLVGLSVAFFVVAVLIGVVTRLKMPRETSATAGGGTP